MLGLRGVPTQKLTALRFSDDEAFRKAARIAAEALIPVDAPGHRTLIVQLEHAALFEKVALKFERVPIADPEKVASKDYALFRKDVFGSRK